MKFVIGETYRYLDGIQYDNEQIIKILDVNIRHSITNYSYIVIQCAKREYSDIVGYKDNFYELSYMGQRLVLDRLYNTPLWKVIYGI